MIFRTNLEASALSDLSDLPSTAASSAHALLQRLLLAHGVVVLAGSDDQRLLLEAIRELKGPGGARDRWNLVLTELRKIGRVRTVTIPEAGLRTATFIDQLEAAWSREIDLAIVSHSTTAQLGVVDGCALSTSRGLEVSTADAVSISSTATSIQSILANPTQAFGSFRDDYFDRVLRPLVGEARKVHIFDRYIFKSVSRALGGQTSRPGALAWLIGSIESTPGPRVEIFVYGASASSGGAYPSSAAALASLRQLWSPTSGGRVTRCTVSTGSWTGHAHDRHLRTDVGIGLKLLAGFDRMQEPTIVDQAGMGWQYLSDRRAMDDLRRAERLFLDSADSTST